MPNEQQKSLNHWHSCAIAEWQRVQCKPLPASMKLTWGTRYCTRNWKQTKRASCLSQGEIWLKIYAGWGKKKKEKRIGGNWGEEIFSVKIDPILFPDFDQICQIDPLLLLLLQRQPSCKPSPTGEQVIENSCCFHSIFVFVSLCLFLSYIVFCFDGCFDFYSQEKLVEA